jgi:hypothetical protein
LGIISSCFGKGKKRLLDATRSVLCGQLASTHVNLL